MTKWLYCVQTDCNDSAREAEFNKWYDEIHIPDVLEISGFIRGTRFVNNSPSEGMAKYFATYEIETDDIDEAMNAFNYHMAKKMAEGRITELLVIQSSIIYRQISCLSE